MAGKQALDLGLIRRIGNGQLTNVSSDRWLPTGVGNQTNMQLKMVPRLSEYLT